MKPRNRRVYWCETRQGQWLDGERCCRHSCGCGWVFLVSTVTQDPRRAWVVFREWVTGEARIAEWERKHIDYSKFGTDEIRSLRMHKEGDTMRDVTVRLTCAEGETVIPMENLGDEGLGVLQWLQDEAHRLSRDPNPVLTIEYPLEGNAGDD